MKHVRLDEAGRARLLVPTAELHEVMETTIGHIAIYGAGDMFVMRALRQALSAVRGHLKLGEDHAMLLHLETVLDEREAAKRKEAGVA